MEARKKDHVNLFRALYNGVEFLHIGGMTGLQMGERLRGRYGRIYGG